MRYRASDYSVACERMVDHNYGDAGEMTSVKGDGRLASASAYVWKPTHSYSFTYCCQTTTFPFPSPRQALTSQICFIAKLYLSILPDKHPIALKNEFCEKEKAGRNQVCFRRADGGSSTDDSQWVRTERRPNTIEPHSSLPCVRNALRINISTSWR